MAGTDVDVVVVGAGMAGLATALDLTAANLHVVVLERGDRPGGRVATDRVDGFTLDRGFQVLNTSYPQVVRRLDLDALEPRPFSTGALVRYGRGLHRVADPRRSPGYLSATLFSELLPWRSKVALAAYLAELTVTPASRLRQRAETTAAEALRRRGLDGPPTERFLRPFLSGVLGEDELETSSRYVDLVLRSFLRGRTVVPARGMCAIPDQLAARLPAGTVRYGTTAELVGRGQVHHAGGTTRTRAVVVATDPTAAGRLLPSVPVPPMRALTTCYHAAPVPPLGEPTLVLDAEERTVANSVVLTAAAPSYSPDERALVATSVLGPEPGGSPIREEVVRRRLAFLYGVPTDDWEHLRTVVVTHALPTATPPLGDLRRPVDLGDGVFVAGDHRDTPSIQGALASGTRAARTVLRWLA